MSGKEYDSFVQFEFHTDLVGEKYKQFIYDVMKRFLYSVDPVSERDWLDLVAVNEHRWNEEGYIVNFFIENKQFLGCKFYLCDETDNFWNKSIIFRDHYSLEDVENVFLISDAFEKFLIDNSIEFSRCNGLR